MPRNIEIKARIESIDACLAKAAAVADHGPTDIAQDDTFFRCRDGRLKLRTFGDGTGELIHYRRADRMGPKESFYIRSPTAAADSLRECLALSNGVIGCVIKHRRLFLAGRTRIHVDDVRGLGQFLELEVVLAEDETGAQAVREAHALMERLGVRPDQLIEGSYLDLLTR